MKNVFPLLIIAVLFNCLTASAQSWLWGRQVNQGLKDYLTSGSVATNRTGNVYHTGSFGNLASFGGGITLTSLGSDVFLVKYDPSGNVLWARQSITTPSPYGNNDQNFPAGWSVASDDSDNAYITGAYGDGITVFEHDTLPPPLPNSPLPFLVKYGTNGNVVWAKSIGNISGIGLSVATDKFGHEYVTGFSATDANNNFHISVFLSKYDRNGNMVWTVKPDSFNRINIDTDAEVGNSVTTDIFGNVYVSGEFQDSLLFGSYKLYSANPGVFIAKFDSNGRVLWAQQSTNNLVSIPLYQRFSIFSYYSPYYEAFPSTYEVRSCASVATDRSGAVYLTGPFTTSQTFGSHNFTVNRNRLSDFFVVKYNSNGTIVWGKEATLLDDSSSWSSSSICTDDSNHIYITGGEDYNYCTSCQEYPVPLYAQNIAFAFGNDTFSCVTNINNSDGQAFLIKLDSSGNAICGSILPGGSFFDSYLPLNQDDATIFVASDSTGKFVYMGGSFVDNLVLGNNNILNSLSDDLEATPYTVRWQACECNLVVSSVPTQTICAGHTATLTTSGAITYTWSPAGSLSSSTGDSVVADPVVTTTYIVTGINSLTGCEATAIDTIYVLEGVNIPIIDTVGNVLISSSTNDNQWFRNDSILTGETGRTDTATVSGWYKVEAINPSNGCNTVSDSIYITVLSGIARLAINGDQLSVYPNPTTGEIVLTINPSAEDVNDWNMQITDVLGQTVYTRSALNYSNDIDLSELPGGVYFITVINKRGRSVVPVTKQ